MASLKPFFSIFAPTNKSDGSNQEEETPDLSPELRLNMTDAQLLALAKSWKAKWDAYWPAIKKLIDQNERYWKGEHFSPAVMETGHAMVDNLIFEALETFIPIATKRPAEPTVSAPPEAVQLAKSVQQYLVAESDIEHLKLKMKRTVRYWAIKLLGVGKLSWDLKVNNSRLDILLTEDVMLDPSGYVDDMMEFNGLWVAHKMKDTVSNIIARFPGSKAYLTERYGDATGTEIKYFEWWTDDYFFCTDTELQHIFGKSNNPHWNYDLEQEKEVSKTDEAGNKVTETVTEKITGANHFEYKKKPFIFLAMFGLGKQPHDETSLIGQNIANQDLINKRNRQIDRNVDKMNAGLVISGEGAGMNKEEAAIAAKAIDKGGHIFIPSGAPNDAVARINGQALPGDLFAQLNDMRRELRSIFGVGGSNAEGLKQTETATGKQIVRETDSDRIGGGISEYLEQFADQYFNWKVQMMYVYYDEAKTATVVGPERATQVVSVLNSDLATTRLVVSVKPGSMLPKDEVSEAATASDLASKDLIDPITLYDKLGFPNPKETAKKLWLWKNAPDALFKDDPEIKAILDQKAAEVAALGAGGVNQ